MAPATFGTLTAAKSVLYVGSMRHHYVPQFLLRRWKNEAGTLHVFAVGNGQLVCRAGSPKSTGFEDRLYAVNANNLGLSEDIIEKGLFGPIDNNAAKVLQKLECRKLITEEEHISWTFFLSSLRLRQPDVLNFLRTDMMTLMKQELLELDKATLLPGGPTTEQWFNYNSPGGMEAASLTKWLPSMIAHDGVSEVFSELKWWIREFAPTDAKLLLSDLPIHWEGGFHNEGFMIQLPIAPNRLFLGARSNQTKNVIDQMTDGDLITRVNRTTLASSSRWVWASNKDETQAFIKENLDILGKNVVTFDSIRANHKTA